MTIFSIGHADENSRLSARHELGAILAVSFMPLLLGLIPAALQNGILVGAKNVFLSGNLYFYAISLCAAMFVLAVLRNEKGNKFLMLWVGVFVILCIGITSVYLGQGGNGDPKVGLWHGWFSIPILGVAIWMYYRVMVLTTAPPPQPETVNRREAEDLAEEVDVDYDS